MTSSDDCSEPKIVTSKGLQAHFTLVELRGVRAAVS
jgi:hypothetical protein